MASETKQKKFSEADLLLQSQFDLKHNVIQNSIGKKDKPGVRYLLVEKFILNNHWICIIPGIEKLEEDKLISRSVVFLITLFLWWGHTVYSF